MSSCQGSKGRCHISECWQIPEEIHHTVVANHFLEWDRIDVLALYIY